MSTVAISNSEIIYAPGTSDAEIEAAAIAAARRHQRLVLAWRLGILAWRLGILALLLGSWEAAARTGVIDPFFYS